MLVWDSESQDGVVPVLTPISEDPDTIMLSSTKESLDSGNGVLILGSYNRGQRTTTLLFFGAQAKVHGERWGGFVRLNEENTALDINTRTEEAIRLCFGLKEVK